MADERLVKKLSEIRQTVYQKNHAKIFKFPKINLNFSAETFTIFATLKNSSAIL